VRHELLAATRGELVAALAQQTRQMILAMIGTVLSLLRSHSSCEARPGPPPRDP
jgi:hypothetical protein